MTDEHTSLGVTDQLDKLLPRCWAGSSHDSVLNTLERRGLWGQKGGPFFFQQCPLGRYGVRSDGGGPADSKKAPVEESRGYGLSDARQHGAAVSPMVDHFRSWVVLFVQFV